MTGWPATQQQSGNTNTVNRASIRSFHAVVKNVQVPAGVQQKGIANTTALDSNSTHNKSTGDGETNQTLETAETLTTDRVERVIRALMGANNASLGMSHEKEEENEVVVEVTISGGGGSNKQLTTCTVSVEVLITLMLNGLRKRVSLPLASPSTRVNHGKIVDNLDTFVRRLREDEDSVSLFASGSITIPSWVMRDDLGTIVIDQSSSLGGSVQHFGEVVMTSFELG